MNEKNMSLLQEIKVNTIAAENIDIVEEWYSTWLDYKVCERGFIDQLLADSWNAPLMKNQPYLVLQPSTKEDKFIRVCKIDRVKDYKPMTSLGWNSFELIVEDVYQLYEKLKESPFKIIGPPASLGGDLDFIHAMQVEGPAKEILYLTCDKVKAPDSLLPKPKAFVGRPFIVILAANGIDEVQEFYCSKFGLKKEEDMQTKIGVIAHAQNLPEEHIYDMGFMALSKVGNFIEYDGYDKAFGERPCNEGQLPPGCSTVTFTVTSLDTLNIDFVGNTVNNDSIIYNGKRSRTAKGFTGELIELVEE